MRAGADQVGLGHDSSVDKQLNDWKMFGRKFNEAPKTSMSQQ